MPGKDAQAQNICQLYKMVGLDVNQTGYVECHGTGTKAGDPVELGAISESLCAQRSSDKPLIVGSIKTNIGHLEGAAGVAGLIKSVLCLEKGIIPPNTNFKEPNPAIHFEEWNLKVSGAPVTFWRTAIRAGPPFPPSGLVQESILTSVSRRFRLN